MGTQKESRRRLEMSACSNLLAPGSTEVEIVPGHLELTEEG